MSDGWVSLWRKSIDSRAFKNQGLWKVWTWCLMKANHEAKWVSVKTGRGETQVLVEKGQFIFGRHSASRELEMSPSTIRNRLALLRKSRNVDTQPDTHYTIVTICNWNEYQGQEDEDRTGKRTGKGQPKDTNNNYNNNKDLSSELIENRLAIYLLNHIKKNNPNRKEPDLKKWAVEIEQTIRIDKRNPEDLKEMIRWSQNDEFWKSNILSPTKLREQFDTLWLKMGKSESEKPYIPTSEELEEKYG